MSTEAPGIEDGVHVFDPHSIHGAILIFQGTKSQEMAILTEEKAGKKSEISLNPTR
jgi:hypothetical protein